MELSDFSSLVEIAATLNIAFVAIEYIKHYSQILCKQVYRLDSELDESVSRCQNAIIDEQSISSLQNADSKRCLNESRLSITIEGLKKSRNDIVCMISEHNKSFKKTIEEICCPKCLSSVSLYHFLYCLTALFLSGIDNKQGWIHVVWTTMTIAAFLYSVIGWRIGKCESTHRILTDYGTLKHPLIWIIIASAVSSATVLIHCSCILDVINMAWPYIVCISLLLMYSNFIASMFKVKNEALKIKDKISQSEKSIKDECEELQNKVKNVIGAVKTLSAIETDKFQEQISIDSEISTKSNIGQSTQ